MCLLARNDRNSTLYTTLRTNPPWRSLLFEKYRLVSPKPVRPRVLGPRLTLEGCSGLELLYRALCRETQGPHRGGGNFSWGLLRPPAIEGGSWVNIIAQLHYSSSNEQTYVGDGFCYNNENPPAVS